MSDLSVARPNLFAPAERPSRVVDDIRLTGWRALVKDCLDRIAAVVALIVLGPVLAYFAVLVRCSGQGPVLVRQVRVGRKIKKAVPKVKRLGIVFFYGEGFQEKGQFLVAF